MQDIIIKLKKNWCFVFLLNFLEKSINYIIVTVPSVILYCNYMKIPEHIVPALMSAFIMYSLHIFIGFGVKQFVLSLMLKFYNPISRFIYIKD